jgi:WD40 repeat protein
MNADGSEQQRLTDHPGKDQHPTWSPDGTKIAFSSCRTGRCEIYVMNADGSEQRQLTEGYGRAWLPDWSPDGAKIAFLSSRDGSEEIYVMNADGSELQQLTDDGAGKWQVDWRPMSTLSLIDGGQRLGNAASWAVSLGDVDGDDDLDALVGNDAQAGVGSALWLNAGGAQGGTPGVLSDSGQDLGSAYGLELGDVDGDGDLDAFVVNRIGSGRVWLNDGAGVFDDSGQRLRNASGLAVALGDVDGDGDLDAFVGSLGANTIWLNEGGAQGGAPGVFRDSGQRLGSAITADVALRDLDGDGDLDALAGGWDEAAKVWLNDGGLQGGTPGVFVDSGHDLSPASIHIHGLSLGDVDGDGDLDAFMAIASGHPNQVWFGDGRGVFRDSEQELTSTLGHDVSLGDLDGDGDLDAFMANGNVDGSANTIWVNEGGAQGGTPGTFGDSGLRLGLASSVGVALGDLDGDGDLDAFVANTTFSEPPRGAHNTVWLNDMLTPATASAPIISPDTVDQVELLSTLSGHSNHVTSLAFSRDGSFIASASMDKTIRLWDVREPTRLSSSQAQSNDATSGQEVHVFGIRETCVNNIAFSPDGSLLACSEAIWDVETKQIVHAFEQSHCAAVAFSPDGSTLAVANSDGPIMLWDIASRQVARTLDGPDGNLSHSIEFSPDGARLAAHREPDAMVKLWDVREPQSNDVESGELLRTFPQITERYIHDVAFSPDSQLLASAGTEGTTLVWDVATGQVLHTLQGNSCWDVTFSPDGSLISTSGCDLTVMLWDVREPTRLSSSQAQSNDVASGRLVRTLEHGGEVMAVAFSPDGALLASGAYDGKVYLWGIALENQ